MLLSNDRALLDAYRRGDRRALDRIDVHYRPKIEAMLAAGFPFRDDNRSLQFFGYSRSFELQDAVQMTFERAFAPGARRGYNGISPFGPYLKQIARYIVLSRHRRMRQAPDRLFGKETVVETVAEQMGAPADPEADLLRSQTGRLIRGFLEQLSPEERDLVRQRFESGMTQTQLAERWGVKRYRIRAMEEQLQKSALRYFKKIGHIGRIDQTELFTFLATMCS